MATKGNAQHLPPIVTELQGDITDLRAAYASAKRMQDEYRRDVEKMSGTWHDAGRDVEASVGRATEAVDDMGVSLDKVSEKSDLTKRKTRELGQSVKDNMKVGESYVSSLRREYERLHLRSKELRAELSKPFSTGRAGADNDLRDTLRDMGELRRIGSDIGIDLGKGISGGVGSVVAGSGPYGMVAIITAAVVGAALVAPALGALIGTALMLGLGAGVVGLGVMILKDDKKIISAAEKLATKTEKVFTRAAQPLKGPFIGALKIIGDTIAKMEPDLKRMFAAVAPLVTGLAKGGMDALAAALPGIVAGLQGAAPLFKSLETTLPILGEAFGNMFKILGENGPAFAIFLKDAIVLFAQLVTGLIVVVAWLSNVYVWMKKTADGIGTWLSETWTKVKTWASDVGKWAKSALKDAGAWLIFGFYDGLRAAWREVKEDAMSIFTGVVDAAKGIFDSHSPSRVFMQIGRDTVLGYAIGVKHSAPAAWAAWAGLSAPTAAPRPARGSGMGVGGLSPVRTPVSALAGGGGGMLYAEVPVSLDSRVIARAIVPVAQRYKTRTGTTGLS